MRPHGRNRRFTRARPADSTATHRGRNRNLSYGSERRRAFHYAAARQHIRNGENGITVPYGDREAFIRAAIHLLGSSERRVRLGDAARASMVRVDWNHIVTEFEGTLTRLVADHERGELAHARA